MNINLEKKVEDRTKELVIVNKDLAGRNNEMKREVEIAKKVQQAILPRELPKFKTLRIGTLYMAMETLGGDYYDVFLIDDKNIGFLIADVSGHGVPAALVTTMAKVTFSSYAKKGMSSDMVCHNVNEDMVSFIGDTHFFVSACYMVYNMETQEMEYSNSGHHAPFHYSPKKDTLFELDTKGFLIGTLPNIPFEKKVTKITPGDKILMFTDGAIECRNDNKEFYGKPRLIEFMKKNHKLPAEQFINELVNEIQAFTNNGPQQDDISLLVIDFL